MPIYKGSQRLSTLYAGGGSELGSSGYNDYAQTSSSHPAIGGYVKITIVE